jgi:hypothetical protein
MRRKSEKQFSLAHSLIRRLVGPVFDNWPNGRMNESNGRFYGRRKRGGLGGRFGTILFRGLGIAVAAGLLEGAAQEELDLPVQAAQIVVRPTLDGLQQCWIDTK